MSFNISKIVRNSLPLTLLLLTACGGGSGSTSVLTQTHTIGGTVIGLAGSVVLRNNGGDDLTVTASGNFTFATSIDNGNTYAVTVFTQPTGQTCSASTGTGTISGSNVSNVSVVCSTNTYSVGGTVSGLSGTVVLQNNNGSNLSVSANGTFTFATPVANGSPYSVSVLSQPSVSQSCSVANGTGTISLGNVSNVTITCATNTYTVGGSVTRLNGSMVLQNNGADDLSVAVNGPFSFPAAVAYSNPYNVSVLSQPAMQLCTVNSGAGTVTSNISNVDVICLDKLGGAMQGVALNLSKTVSTFASAPPGTDGTGGTARFNTPQASVSDGTNLYVADSSNHTIRKIVIATGVVTTLAGQAGVAGAADGIGTAATFNYPNDITIDPAFSNLYVADTKNNKIRQVVISSGSVSSVTGTANTASTAGAQDGAGTTATFNWPDGIATDGTNLYVADNNKIRKIVIATGVVSSFTGTASTVGTAGAADGAASTATFYNPRGITTDGTNLYVSDELNHKIRQIVIATGVVSSLTGSANTASTAGAVDGAGTSATFNLPTGITTDGTNLYVADLANNKIRQIVIATGMASSLTGTAHTASTAGVVDGASTTATFFSPRGITTDGANLYVADTSSDLIRKIVLGSLTVSTLAGGKRGTDGTGAVATFRYPAQIATDGINLYVADRGGQTIRQIAIASGAVTTLAGQAGVSGAADGIGTAATFKNPWGITTDGTNLYVADSDNNKIRKIVIATGAVSSLTGAANTASSSGAADGAGTSATFSWPRAITTDGTNLYVADSYNNKIRKIVIATGVVSSLTGTTNTASSSGAADGAGTAATFGTPYGITTDGTNLYVADTYNHKIRKIVIATGVVSSLTGAANTAGTSGALDGAGTGAKFYFPHDITTDGTNLYVVDTANYKIRQIVIATGAVSSLTGAANSASTSGAADGAGTVATFNWPWGITTDGTSLYVADYNNSTIRKIQ